MSVWVDVDHGAHMNIVYGQNVEKNKEPEEWIHHTENQAHGYDSDEVSVMSSVAKERRAFLYYVKTQEIFYINGEQQFSGGYCVRYISVFRYFDLTKSRKIRTAC